MAPTSAVGCHVEAVDREVYKKLHLSASRTAEKQTNRHGTVDKSHQKITKRSPKGHQKINSHQKITTRSLKGHQKVTKRSPNDHEKVIRRSPNGHQKITKRSTNGHQKNNKILQKQSQRDRKKDSERKGQQKVARGEIHEMTWHGMASHVPGGGACTCTALRNPPTPNTRSTSRTYEKRIWALELY